MAKRTQRAVSPLGEFDTRPAAGATARLQKSMFVGASAIKRTAGVVEPPFQMAGLVSMLSTSPALRPAIDAYTVNIDAFGQEIVPMIDLARDDIVNVVRSAIRAERKIDAEAALLATGKVVKPKPVTDADVAARLALLAEEMEDERQDYERWERSACPDLTFTGLRKKTRVDLELTGNAYWEVLRNELGHPVQVNHMPVTSIVATSLGDPIEVQTRIHATPITIMDVKQTRRFRRYVQMGGGSKPVYFKEHGDRRLMSAASGVYYETTQAMAKEEPEAVPATEVRHFRLATPENEVYGVPRWSGCILGLKGSRAAEEVNYLYFNNKSVPPLAILVSGATVSKETIDELQATIAGDLHGVKNFHRALLIQAESSASALGAGTAKIELKPLMQVSEGQFMAYIEKNAAALVGSFRLPQIYRGATEGYNRANAQVAVEMTEQQVFQPERDEFDALINRFFFYDLGIRYWRFRTKGPPPANLEERAKILIEAAKEGIPTHNEARQVLSAFFGRDLERIDSPWADLPNPVALNTARLIEEARLLPESSGDAGKVSDSGGTNGKQGSQERGSRRKADSDSG